MKRLVNAAENASLKATMFIDENPKLSAGNDDFDNACSTVTYVINELNKSIEQAKQTSGSALVQSKLLTDAKELIEPGKSMMERSRSVIESIDDIDAKDPLLQNLVDLETALANLSSEIYKTDEVSQTLEVDAATELIASLKDDLEDFQNLAKTLGL